MPRQLHRSLLTRFEADISGDASTTSGSSNDSGNEGIQQSTNLSNDMTGESGSHTTNSENGLDDQNQHLSSRYHSAYSYGSLGYLPGGLMEG